MNLTDAQKNIVRQWLQDGLKLAEVQKRLATEWGINVTYMEVRLLVSDLQVMPKNAEPPAPPPPAPLVAPKPPAPAPENAALPAEDAPLPEEPAPNATLPGSVSLSVDTVAMPGSALSGKVTFSDGQHAQWYLDQYGRLGIAAQQKGYRPSPADVQAFQMRLQQELEKLGF